MRFKAIVPAASCLAVMMSGQALAGTFEKTSTGVVVKPDSGAKEVRLLDAYTDKLGIQRSAGLPECATPPEEVYELAKRRGMDFVTITDHDTIDGVLTIADRPGIAVPYSYGAANARGLIAD